MAPTNPLQSFHLALVVEPAQLAALSDMLPQLMKSGAIKEFDLRATAPSGSIMALLGCGGAGTAMVLKPRLIKLFEGVPVEVVEVYRLAKKEELDAFERRVNAHPVRAHSSQGVETAIGQLRRAFMDTPPLRIDFSGPDEFLSAWVRQVAEGAMWVPSAKPPPAKAVKLTFVIKQDVLDGVKATVVDKPPLAGFKGYWLDCAVTPDIKAYVEKHSVTQRPQGRKLVQGPGGDRRQVDRYESTLEVQFDNFPDLATEFTSNISKGGMFVRCPKPPPLRTKIDLRLKLPSEEVVALRAEVVHVLTPEVAATMKTSPGVGVAFVGMSPEDLKPIEALLSTYEQRTPKVLIVDPDPAFRAQLARGLALRKVEVDEAIDGKDALVKLIDRFFELDMVVADLDMPNLDGRSLVDRIRKQGGESTLKVMLIANVAPDAMKTLAWPIGATGVLSKKTGVEDLIRRICAELGVRL